MGPDQTAPIGAVWSGSTLLAKEAAKTFQQTTSFLIGSLRVKGISASIFFGKMLFAILDKSINIYSKWYITFWISKQGVK